MTAQSPSKVQLWAGRVVSAVVVLGLAMSAVMKLTHNPEMVAQFVDKFGYSANILTTLAVLELGCAVIYAVPKTRFLGAILLTGYLGGAVATHLRVSDPFVAPLVLGVLVWLGLFLRDPKLRQLIPVETN